MRVSACLLCAQRSIDLLPAGRGENYAPVKDLPELSSVPASGEEAAKGLVKRICTNVAKAGIEWGENRLQDKSHLIVSVDVYREEKREGANERTPQRWQYHTQINVIRICGCEYAKTGNGADLGEADRQFATNSFNTISNQILQASLNARIKQSDGPKKALPLSNVLLGKFLQRSVTGRHKLCFASCVALYQPQLPNTLPIMKFVSRIRDCICSELTKRAKSASNKHLGSRRSSAIVGEDSGLAADRVKEELDAIERMFAHGPAAQTNPEQWMREGQRQVARLSQQVEERLRSDPKDSVLLEQRNALIKILDRIEEEGRKEPPQTLSLSEVPESPPPPSRMPQAKQREPILISTGKETSPNMSPIVSKECSPAAVAQNARSGDSTLNALLAKATSENNNREQTAEPVSASDKSKIKEEESSTAEKEACEMQVHSPPGKNCEPQPERTESQKIEEATVVSPPGTNYEPRLKQIEEQINALRKDLSATSSNTIIT